MGFKSQAHMDMVDYLRIPYNEIIFLNLRCLYFLTEGVQT